jgi:hypothetical protein
MQAAGADCVRGSGLTCIRTICLLCPELHGLCKGSSRTLQGRSQADFISSIGQTKRTFDLSGLLLLEASDRIIF